MVAALVLLLTASPLVAAGSFPVSQEYVGTGSTSGLSGVQSEDGIFETLTEVNTAVDVPTAPGVQTLTQGSLVAGVFPSNVSSADGAYVQYRSAEPPAVVLTAFPATTLAGCMWLACDSGRLPDNASATSTAGGDIATYGSFALSVPAASAVTSVYIGYEAFEPTGNDRLSMMLSWNSGTSWCPASTVNLPGADSNSLTFLNVTACTGHTWAPADFGPNLSVRFTHVNVGGADAIDLNANAVRVTYQPLIYGLTVRYDWSGVPSGLSYSLQIRGRISTANVSLEVLTPPSTWTPRLALTSPANTTLTYPLVAPEIASGNVSVRFRNTTAPGVFGLWVDLAVVVSAQRAYRLDVEQNVTGISGGAPTLIVKGNITAGAENFDVFVWNYSTGAWTLALNAPFTATNAIHSYALSATEILSGSTRVDFRGHGPAGASAATLSLDVVRVDTTDATVPSEGPPWALIGGGIAMVLLAAGLLIFLLFRRRKRPEPRDSDPEIAKAPDVAKPPRPAEPPVGPEGADTPSETRPPEVAVEAAAPAAMPSAAPAAALAVAPVAEAAASPPDVPPPDAAETTLEIPNVKAASLEGGHAYLAVEDEPGTGLRVLEAVTRLGRSGLLVTQRYAAEVQALAQPKHTRILVLGEEPGTARGPLTEASGDAILSAIDTFLQKNPVGAVLVDGLEELAGPQPTPALLDLLQHVTVKVFVGQQILVGSIAADALARPGWAALQSTFETVRVSVPPARPAAATDP